MAEASGAEGGAEEGVEAREEVIGEFAFPFWRARQDFCGDGGRAGPGQDFSDLCAKHRPLQSPRAAENYSVAEVEK